jgi:hypothetical protein
MTSTAEYQKLALRTEAPMDGVFEHLLGSSREVACAQSNRNIRLIHAALGLSSDLDELIAAVDLANAIEESGDEFWFTAIACEALEINIQDAIEWSSNPRHWIRPSGRRYPDTRAQFEEEMRAAVAAFASDVKAMVFYGKHADKDGTRLTAKMKGALFTFVHLLGNYCQVYLGVSPSAVMAANIAKLQARYPGKFSAEAALNRDTDAEKAAIAQHT